MALAEEYRVHRPEQGEEHAQRQPSRSAHRTEHQREQGGASAKPRVLPALKTD
jgi:hypothetical protein